MAEIKAKCVPVYPYSEPLYSKKECVSRHLLLHLFVPASVESMNALAVVDVFGWNPLGYFRGSPN
ncbi:MAG TPA: hypothetical protein PK821_02190 [Victivallales bacterium]|nr:hypothetical protein [Victivallales bacterium]